MLDPEEDYVSAQRRVLYFGFVRAILMKLQDLLVGFDRSTFTRVVGETHDDGAWKPAEHTATRVKVGAIKVYQPRHT